MYKEKKAGKSMFLDKMNRKYNDVDMRGEKTNERKMCGEDKTMMKGA